MAAELPDAGLLRVEHLTRHFKIGGALSRRTLHAVDDVSFSIAGREIVALAGESGSGKSTIARLLARIYRPTAGEMFFEGTPLSQLKSRRDQLRYSGLVPMVFQDPFSSINPVFRVQHGVLRSLKLHRPSLSAAGRLQSAVSRSDVTFRTISEMEARDYWNTGEPRDKAGGYAIQGHGAVFVAELRGSYSGVMGLPLYETAEFLRLAGVPRWRLADHGNDR